MTDRTKEIIPLHASAAAKQVWEEMATLRESILNNTGKWSFISARRRELKEAPYGGECL